jgi:glycosyltransferase involved in cell wall biosynthesis
VIEAAFAIPGDIDLPTGGYAYDRHVLALLPSCDVDARHVVLPGSFPAPQPADLDQTERLLRAIAPHVVLMVDGLAYGAMPAALVARLRNPIVALVHHPLYLEAGLSPARRDQLFEQEKAALALAKRVVVTSRTTADTVAKDFSVSPATITVAEPGTEPMPRAVEAAGPVHILSVGSVVARKAHDVLVRALAPLRDQPWRLTLAGATDRDPAALAALNAAIGETRLGDRITLTGPLPSDALARLYGSAGIFVLPSLYEGYGMALAEAMSAGVPIVCTTGGAAAETVPDTAALKVPPGDAGALGAALRRLLDDDALRRRMADASWTAGRSLPRWEDTARRVAGVIKELAA